MSANGIYRSSHKFYSAWNYQREIEDLNKASEQGWQLVRGGCFSSRFIKNPDIRFRYQMDYQRVDDMGRYIETYREQGWEYINSTFNGWHYFRKLYDPSLPEEEYEIFTDRESLHEMNSRWARIAFIIAVLVGIVSVICAIMTFVKPRLPMLVEAFVLAVECYVLLRGVSIMRDPEASRNRRHDSIFMAAFLVFVFVGTAGYIYLGEARPHFVTEQRTDSLSEPMVDNRSVDFEVRYTDNYYFDLDLTAKAPFTFRIVNEAGVEAFSVTDTSFSKDDIRVKLAKGHYWLSFSCNDGYILKCKVS